MPSAKLAAMLSWPQCFKRLTHWGRATHICIGKLTIIGSDNGLPPGRRQAIIWTNDEILLIRPFGTNFSEILIGNQTFSFMKMHLEMLSVKCRPFCPGGDELMGQGFPWWPPTSHLGDNNNLLNTSSNNQRVVQDGKWRSNHNNFNPGQV